jgi:hypothetical protein
VIPGPPTLNEKELTKAVAALAKDRGWHRYHTHRSDFSPAGYPDETLVRDARLVIAELKSEGGKLSPQQEAWLEELRAVAGIEVYLWRPSQWWDGTIERVLW